MTPAVPAKAPAASRIQRAPIDSVSQPATTIPVVTKATFVLIIIANARPRRASGAPRWTSSALQTIAEPFPQPATITEADATQTFGAAAAPPIPSAISTSEMPYTLGSPRRAIQAEARSAPTVNPSPAQPIIRPRPKRPALNVLRASLG